MTSLASISADPYDCVVIDDDPDICVLISHVLARIGVKSVGLSSAEALAAALKAARHPAIIFLDVALDRSDAIDGIRILRQTSFQGAVQLISGKDSELLNDIKAIGERNGLRMLDPLRKPFRSEHLRRFFESDGVPAPEPARETSAVPPRASEGRAPIPVIDLDEALAAHWIDMHYQPKVDLALGHVVGAEGLARVNHPVHGILGPASFLPGASAPALGKLTEFVIRKAFLDWEVMRQADRNLHLSVNSPVKALTGPGIAELVRDFHPRTKEWPGLIIEVTEEEAVKEFDAVAEAAVQLRIYGVTLAIDDFGSGYSSFARLKQFPFSELKLDRSYVHNCASDPVNASICQSIVDLARASGAVCVAEGIEAEADCAALTGMGCNLGQGYLFGRPMSVGKLIERTSD